MYDQKHVCCSEENVNHYYGVFSLHVLFEKCQDNKFISQKSVSGGGGCFFALFILSQPSSFRGVRVRVRASMCNGCEYTCARCVCVCVCVCARARA